MEAVEVDPPGDMTPLSFLVLENLESIVEMYILILEERAKYETK